jgi:hypothetical protein
MFPCCENFLNLAVNAAQKGISIVPRFFAGERMFFIQARPFDDAGLAALKNIGVSLAGEAKSVGVQIEMNLPINFCPSCGTNLMKIVKSDVREFDQLADKLAHIWEPKAKSS